MAYSFTQNPDNDCHKMLKETTSKVYTIPKVH